jgi:hypothetical protein
MPITPTIHGQVLRSPNREDVTRRLEERTRMQHDSLVNSTDIVAHVHDDNTLEYYLGGFAEDKTPINFCQEAFAQLLNRLRIPTDFYNRNPADLRLHMFSYWNRQYDKTCMLRYTDHGNTVRAVLSGIYGLLDDHVLYPAALTELGENDIELVSFSDDHHLSRLLVKFPSTTVQHNNITIAGGLAVSNSETGYAATYVEPIIFSGSHVFCNRTAVIGLKPIIHKGSIDLSRISTMVATAREASQVGVVQLAESMHEYVSGSHAAVLASKVGIGRYASILKDELEVADRISKYELAMRILSVAAQLPLFKAVSVEQQVGAVLGIFRSHRSRIQSIRDELTETGMIG